MNDLKIFHTGVGSLRTKQRGLSLIEVMIGMVVALLVSLAAASAAMQFTSLQRQGIGAGGSGMSAASSLSAIKNDAALAGLGFFGDGNFLCSQMVLSSGGSIVADGAAFSPFQLTAVGTDVRIDLAYADRVEAGANIGLTGAAGTANAVVGTYLPAQVGDAVLLAKAGGVGPCLVRSVTAVTAATPSTPLELAFDNTGTYNQKTFTTATTYGTGDRIAMLGQLNWNSYRRTGNNLTINRPMDGTSAVIAENVIALRGQYGVSTAAGQTTLSSWENPSGTFATLDSTNINRVRAVRIGIVTRSPQRGKPNAAGVCEVTSVMPQLFGTAVAADVTDWQCYRYTVSTVVVPLRNIIMGLGS